MWSWELIVQNPFTNRRVTQHRVPQEFQGYEATVVRDTILGGPYNKDCSSLGSTLGSPYLGKLPYEELWGPY